MSNATPIGFKRCNLIAALSIVVGAAIAAGTASAAPVVWTMTGQVSAVADQGGIIAANSALGVAVGRQFSLTYTFDNATPATVTDNSTYTQWVEAGRSSLALNVGGAFWSTTSAGQYEDSVVNTLAYQKVLSNNLTQVSPSGNPYAAPFSTNMNLGFTPTTFTSSLSFYFFNYGQTTSLSGFNWPPTIYISEWSYRYVIAYMDAVDPTSLEHRTYQVTGVISNFASSADAVPAPGALALLGLGIIGIAGLRRRPTEATA
jgi:hypothetical protein